MSLTLHRWLLPLLVLISVPAFAASDACEKLILSGADEEVARERFANFVENYEDGLGVRGYMGGGIPNTAANIDLALEYGLIWWGMKWNFAPSVEAAVEHRLKVRQVWLAKESPFTDIIVSGQYIIGSEEELGLQFGEDKKPIPVPPEKVRELMARGAYEIDFEGRVKKISPEQLKRRVNVNGMNYFYVKDLPESVGKNSISQSGWVAYKQHGLHDYSTWKETSDAKKLMKKARTLADRGFTIRFNTDYELMLVKINNQIRSYRDLSVDEHTGEIKKGKRIDHDVSRSRYSDPGVYNSALSALKAGKGYSVGVYNERGELVGGEIGFRKGNHFYGDSVFYDDDVDLAKIAALALFQYLYDRGMPYSDPGMITKYTYSMGAELVPFHEYLQKIKSGPAQPIELPSQWDPRSNVELDITFQELAKRKNVGLGSLKIMRRNPVDVSEEVVAAADRAGLARAQLRIVFVNTPEEASDYIRSHPDIPWADLPVFVMGAATDVAKDALAFLRTALSNESAPPEVFFIGSARHPDVRKAIPLKQLVDMLELKVTGNPPKWIPGAALPTVGVYGWGIKADR